ncbi:adenylate/guanylate cyclase domain-containing protein [Blastococcus sp. TML/M2B]|uniref:adenylate/guanylate cyclase domain-containing protein n=1 Tax=unclassified Blastococcus TaxID=2619396 RepID=UPI00190DC5E5|nr:MULTISPECIES: adenylate/guanylate cyclase domain-containing protein [unclassified Blastococcus]MBN1091793.1 adenylate/guanylate cyclase domain-containing protein [Blastococcus sp. TML/M2B]MBN1094647.1 adenylate/guanylate cyclase domain-containing protein [Blastococcus sp. TML/C7B]
MTSDGSPWPVPVARAAAWAEWAPSGRSAVPFIALLVIVANLVGVGTVVLLLLGVDDGSGRTGRTEVLWTAVAYLVLALPAGGLAGLRRQRSTTRWLLQRREPTPAEAGQALRLPLDVALVAAAIWLVAAVLMSTVVAMLFPEPLVGLRVAVVVTLGGVVTAGVTYLLTARAARAVTAIALAAHPPVGALVLGVRPRLLLTWALTSGVPMLGVVLLFLDPSDPDGPGEAAVVFLVVVALLVGALATLLTARAVGQPLRELRRAVQQVGRGDYGVDVLVDDAGEIGLLQEGVNTMVAGLAERERLRDLFGRHVGTTVAQEALRTGVSLGGEERVVAALFVDIAGSTSLVRRTGPEQMVGLLNRFFAVVVETVEEEGGLVNKFEGDAALCVFGAPTDHPDPAGAALRAARRICDAVAVAGEVDVGVGVACGPVWAGQVGAASRLEYTVIGDPVNEAARLTELAKDHPGRAVASGPTVLGAPPDEREQWVRGAEVTLRGRDEATTTWVRAPA